MTLFCSLQLNWVWAVGVAYDQLLGTRCGSESHVTKKARHLTPLSWVHRGKDRTGGDKGNKEEESVCKGLVRVHGHVQLDYTDFICN